MRARREDTHEPPRDAEIIPATKPASRESAPDQPARWARACLRRIAPRRATADAEERQRQRARAARGRGRRMRRGAAAAAAGRSAAAAVGTAAGAGASRSGPLRRRRRRRRRGVGAASSRRAPAAAAARPRASSRRHPVVIQHAHLAMVSLRYRPCFMMLSCPGTSSRRWSSAAPAARRTRARRSRRPDPTTTSRAG